MLDIERVLRQDRLLRALTGLNRKAFEALLVALSPLYEQSRQTQPRQRAVGGGRKARLLSTQEKLFFILFYFKCYPTFRVFPMLQSGKSSIILLLSPLGGHQTPLFDCDK